MLRVLDVSNRSRLDLELVERESRALLATFAQLLEELGHADAAAALPLVGRTDARLQDRVALRAVTIGLHLLSLVEQRATEAHRREARARGAVESGLWASTVAELATRPGGLDALRQVLGTLRVEPVFTAHPTEARRISALEQWLELASEPAGADRERLWVRLERLFRTGDVRLRKPRLEDERDVVIHTLTRVVAPALARVTAAADEVLRPALEAPAEVLGPALTFGTWVGGDRDGHPFVTAELTADSLASYRRAALAMHERALTELTRKLSLSGLLTPAPDDLAARLAEVRAQLEARGEEAARYPEEPLRAWAASMLARLPRHEGQPREGDYSGPQALLADLELLRSALSAVGAGRLARADVDPVIAAVRSFGFHLVSVDIRQNSFVHDRALDALRRSASETGSFGSWEEPTRRAYLDRELETARPFAAPGTALEPDAELAVAPLRVIAAHRARLGEEGIGGFIVSMARDVSDLEVPYLLAREAGLLLRTEDGLASPLQVVPLFETVDDLRRAPLVLDAYLALPIVQRSLRLQAGDGPRVQQVMVGYSDSNKDAGPCASLWSVHVAQRELLAVAARHGVQLRFFHGRGGSLSRGAGPTFRFLSALPAGAVQGGLRLTEQGESVFQKYGTVDAAAYNLELLLAGAARARALDLLDADAKDRPELAQGLDRVAEVSAVAYRRLLETDGLLAFFRTATPIDVIEQSGIGSRPSRRSGQASLADLRAIPWVFAWAQSRVGLTGWFGFGSGLEALERDDRTAFEALIEHALRWPPLRYVVGNVGVSVLAVDAEVTARYAELVEDDGVRGRVAGVLDDELARTRRMLDRVYGAPLERARPRVHRLMSLRAASLRQVHDRQIELLRDWRARGRPDDLTKVELLGTVNAIAAGLRTTG